MLPLASTAGLPTGCRLSAICVPSEIGNGELSIAAHFHAHGAARRAFRHAGDQSVFRREHHRRVRGAELHLRPRVIPRSEAAAGKRDFAARKPGSRLYALDSGYAVHFFRKDTVRS